MEEEEEEEEKEEEEKEEEEEVDGTFTGWNKLLSSSSTSPFSPSPRWQKKKKREEEEGTLEVSPACPVSAFPASRVLERGKLCSCFSSLEFYDLQCVCVCVCVCAQPIIATSRATATDTPLVVISNGGRSSRRPGLLQGFSFSFTILTPALVSRPPITKCTLAILVGCVRYFCQGFFLVFCRPCFKLPPLFFCYRRRRLF